MEDGKRERYNKYKREYAASHQFHCLVCNKVLRRGSKNRYLVSKGHLKAKGALDPQG